MKNVLRVSVVVLICALASLYGDDNLAEEHAINAQQSRLIVHAYKSGLFSGFAHDHEIEAPISHGNVDLKNRRVELEFDVSRMKVLDPKESAEKRTEIQNTMLSDKVLDATQYPKIRFVSRVVKQTSDGAYEVEGDLSLHGTSRPVSFPVKVKDGIFSGKVPVTQTQFGIKPVSIAGGTVKVKDVVDIEFQVRLN
jgi:polyisoprenoid-binding protein YceI